jgi:hypothetical protein
MLCMKMIVENICKTCKNGKMKMSHEMEPTIMHPASCTQPCLSIRESVWFHTNSYVRIRKNKNHSNCKTRNHDVPLLPVSYTTDSRILAHVAHTHAQTPSLSKTNAKMHKQSAPSNAQARPANAQDRLCVTRPQHVPTPPQEAALLAQRARACHPFARR